MAQIITFGTMGARLVIRDVARVMRMSIADADKIAKMVPFELKMTIDKALERNPKLQAEYNNNPEAKQVIDVARKLEGMPRHASTHAAGVVIADAPITEYVPCLLYTSKMEKAAEELNFEQAALLRDRLALIDRIREKQRAGFPNLNDKDVFAIEKGLETAVVQAFLFRNGKLDVYKRQIMRSLQYSLAQAAQSFLRLEVKKNKELLQNIIYLGLKEQTELVVNGHPRMIAQVG